MSLNRKVSGQVYVRKLKQAWRRVARKGRTLVKKTYRLPAGREAGHIRPENILWIFGSGRTGSTWLSAMMEEIEDQTVWREPLVGMLFGHLYYVHARHRIGKQGKHFILGGGYKETWLGPMRDMVLGGAPVRFPEVVEGGYLVIKEPNGSIGAPLLMEALPESRMILLVRDPRDVVASSMDAGRRGGWLYENRNKGEREQDALPDSNPDTYAKKRAHLYVRDIGNAKQAYDAHQGYKILVRYEELRTDTLNTMRRVYTTLGIAVAEGELARAVEKYSWEEIPEEQKGEGKFYRKATPGGWREDLTPEQARIVERITGPLLKEFYPDDAP